MATALIVIPLTVAARPTAGVSVSAADLAQRVQRSGDVPWSGFVQSSGTLQVPESGSFAGLAQLLGQDNDLRVWWRDPHHYRIDRIRGTGETDLFRRGQETVRWVFESRTATITPVSRVRLPDASDLLPPTLARAMLQGFRNEEITRLPTRRVAGVDTAGVRLDPQDSASTVDHVDLWVDPLSGLALDVELYVIGDPRPSLSTTVQTLSLAQPSHAAIEFDPPASVDVDYEDSVDVAAAANAFAPYDLPRSLGGMETRDGSDPGAVGIYGRGPTTLIVLPLRGQVAYPLGARLRASAAAQESDVGTLAPVGPVELLLTRDPGQGGGFLLAGTVSAELIERAAAQLLAQQ